MSGICKLCHQEKKLKESHIIPKFVFRWIKESGNGFMRNGQNFNRRVQDGFKTPFLCADCEDRFSKYETYFATNIFYPVVNEKEDELEYTDQLYLFAISVLWRLLCHTILPEEKSVHYYKNLITLELEWRTILLNGKTSRRELNLHLLTGVDVATPMAGQPIVIPERFLLYMARNVDAGITDNRTKAMLFLKLPRFLFIYPLHGFDNQQFINSALSSKGGMYYLNDVKINDPDVGNFFTNRVKMFEGMLEDMSQKQKDKMRNFTDETWPDVENKDLGVIYKYQQQINKV